MSDRLVLRQILKNILELSNEMNGNSIAKICQLIGKVTTSVLDLKLPDPEFGRIKNIYSTDIYENSNICCSVFGMQKEGGRIPLHDHHNCYGFIRVLRGQLKIRSFSLLEKRKEIELINETMKNSKDYNQDMLPVIYEGEQIASADEDTVLMLDPKKGNIHEVIAMQDGTAFFDILIPGYKSPCMYYSQIPGKSNAFKTGDVSWLQVVDMPHTYYTDYIPYHTLESL